MWIEAHCLLPLVLRVHRLQNGVCGFASHFKHLWPFRVGVNHKRSDLPMNGPAKSIWILCHDLVGQTQGCSGAAAGACLTLWQGKHQVFNLLVKTRPPCKHTTSCQAFVAVTSSASIREYSWFWRAHNARFHESGNDNHDSLSAFACSRVVLNFISYW